MEECIKEHTGDFITIYSSYVGGILCTVAGNLHQAGPCQRNEQKPYHSK